MSLEEYHARQRTNEAQNQAAVTASTEARTAKARQHLKRALELLDREASPEAYQEIERALQALA
ncbi:MAG: hypothetical protein ACRENP_17815 [Longimicrobiales bacterium]